MGRIIHRITTEPALPLFLGKAIALYALGNSHAMEIGEGNHHILVANSSVQERWLASVRIAHFPICSIEQFVYKVVKTRLAWLSRGDYRHISRALCCDFL